jgi:hypothetical protein
MIAGEEVASRFEGASQVFDFSQVSNILQHFSRFFTLFAVCKRLIFRGLEKIGGYKRRKQFKNRVKNAKIGDKARHELHELARIFFREGRGRGRGRGGERIKTSVRQPLSPTLSPHFVAGRGSRGARSLFTISLSKGGVLA